LKVRNNLPWMISYLFSIVFLFITENNLKAQNTGTVTFNVTTHRTYQNYDPKNISAIWVTDDSNNFIQTLKKRAQTREQYLYTWIASSSHNTVNAITGATLSSHQSHTVVWNCTNANGDTVPDGWYRIRCEYTTKHAQGPWTPADYIQFYKGASPLDMTFNDYNYDNRVAFSGMSLVYMPSVTDINSEESLNVINNYLLHQNYPNPFNPSTTIEFEVPYSDQLNNTISMKVFNSSGQIVSILYEGIITGGKYETSWNGKNESGISLPSGIYYLQLKAKDFTQTRKMMLVR